MLFKVKDIWHQPFYDPKSEFYVKGLDPWVYSDHEGFGDTELEKLTEFLLWIARHNNGKISGVYTIDDFYNNDKHRDTRQSK